MHKRKDGFLELNEWKTRDLLQILEDKSEWFGKSGDVLENKWVISYRYRKLNMWFRICAIVNKNNEKLAKWFSIGRIHP